MRPGTYTLFWISNLLVVGTGLIYGWMRYFAPSDDPYAIVNHPWQPHLQHAHIVVAPLLVFMVGQFWVAHAKPYIRSNIKEGRRSGISLLALAGVMIFSGYLIQIAVEPGWRTAWVWAHGVSSTLWILLLAGHFLTHRIRR